MLGRFDVFQLPGVVSEGSGLFECYLCVNPTLERIFTNRLNLDAHPQGPMRQVRRRRCKRCWGMTMSGAATTLSRRCLLVGAAGAEGLRVAMWPVDAGVGGLLRSALMW